MRRILPIIVVLSMILCSCDSFLEYKQGDILIPKTTDNYKEFIYGEIIKESSGNTIRNLEFMTDNVQEGISSQIKSDLRKDLWGYYTWQRIPERNYIHKVVEDNIWALQYHKILSCNVVLDNVENMIGSENDKNVVKAEALFMRAYSYLILANTYAKPYTTEDAAKLPKSGVPINDKTSIEEDFYTRSTLFEVYELIENDLKESIDLFAKSTYEDMEFRPNIDAARLILSRAYLYQKKYRECNDVATALINSTSRSIPDMKNYIKKVGGIAPPPPPPPPMFSTSVRMGAAPPPPPPPPPGPGVETIIGLDFLALGNTGIIFSYGENLNSEFQNNAKYFYKASDELMALFTGSDYRKYVGWDPVVKTKPWKYKATDMYDKCLRIEEAFLNRAEALTELNEGDLGKADITHLRTYRMPNGIDLPMGTQEEARKAVREERRRELCFEDQRWFDLRRWMEKDIIHTYTLGDKTITYTLKKDSESYTLPVPQKVLLQNKVIENINRPVRNND